MNLPLISIITPCFNGSKFIRECIESILAQDYPHIEHIIQDGASTDGTVGIIKEYAEKYPDKIKFVSEPDKGQSDGLNKAIQRSRGDILLVLNADDALMPRACSWAVKNMAKYSEMAVIYGDVYIIDENSKAIEEFRAKPYDFEQLLCVELVPPAQAAFIRRSYFEQVGFYADDSLDTCPDYEMWVRIGLKFPMKYVPGFVTRYRRHNSSEAQRPEMMEKFVVAKKSIMDRVFNNEKSSKRIKNIRYRAYSGLIRWLREVCIDAKLDIGIASEIQMKLIPFMNLPLITIITPCFNGSKFIRECIESILAQDYPHIEHIIQDGASTDGTVGIIKEYAEKYPDKIKFVSEPDKGQSDGLNKAIQRSSGDILLVLNADDALMPYACSWAVKNMAKYSEMAVIYGDVYIIDENSKAIEEFRAKPYDFEQLLCVELVPPAQAAFIRRSYFEQVGFYADDSLDTCPDYEMWVRIGLKFPMKYVPGFVTRYRRHIQIADSKKLRTVQRFFDAKKLVMDRVFNSPRTAYSIKNIRERAYGGLSMWAAVTEYGINNNIGKKIKFSKSNISIFLIKSFWYYNKRGHFRHFYKLSLSYASLYFKRLVNIINLSFRSTTLDLKRFARKIFKKILVFMPAAFFLFIAKVSGIPDFRRTFHLTAKENKLSLFQKWQKLLYECHAYKKQK